MRRLLARAAQAFNNALPESDAKNRLRAGILSTRHFLPKELAVRKGDTVVQVGMWSPEHLRRLLAAIGPTGRVVLIEISADVVREFRQFLEAEGISNVTLVNKGAWSSKGIHRLNVGVDPDANQLEIENVDMPAGHHFVDERQVEVDTVDNVLAELGWKTVDYAEVTVNGVELEVLAGMSDSLPHVRRLLVAGMMRERDSGEPLNKRVAAVLESRGFRTRISQPGNVLGSDWGQADGFVFGWRTS